MKSPTTVFAVALVQILLVALLLPLLIILFVAGLIWRRFDWKKVISWVQSIQFAKPKSPAKTSREVTENKELKTYDVEFESKKKP